MSKIANMKERVHQPYRDVLVRCSGYETPNPAVQQTGQLFIRQNANVGETNLPTGSQLPSDNSLVVLGVRCFLWFRKSEPRTTAGGNVVTNGDFLSADYAANANAAPGTHHDVLRLYYQASEQIFWTIGTGEKNSIKSMPSSYFPWGGGLHGDMGGATDLILWNNGMPDHTGILRLARAIVLPPRQQILAQYQISNLIPQNAAAALAATLTQGNRNMMDVQGNLNAIDLVQKTIALALDGLLSRDVQ